VPPGFLSSGLVGWSHDDLHLLRGKLLLDRGIPSILLDFVKEVSWIPLYLLGLGVIVLGLVIFEVLVAVVIGPTTTTAMIFLEKLEIVLVERPRDHPVLFHVAFVIDLYLTKASI
jgi:hypothetical protein